jgi:hypothetical protein
MHGTRQQPDFALVRPTGYLLDSGERIRVRGKSSL